MADGHLARVGVHIPRAHGLASDRENYILSGARVHKLEAAAILFDPDSGGAAFKHDSGSGRCPGSLRQKVRRRNRLEHPPQEDQQQHRKRNRRRAPPHPDRFVFGLRDALARRQPEPDVRLHLGREGAPFDSTQHRVFFRIEKIPQAAELFDVPATSLAAAHMVRHPQPRPQAEIVPGV
jgi:hypothetical protein